MKRINTTWLLSFRMLICAALLATSTLVFGQVKLNAEGRDGEYVKTIINRSQKIANTLKLTESKTVENVVNIIANHYFMISDIESANADEVARGAELYKHHFELQTALSLYLDDNQIEQVKDGLTYGVVPKTYQAHLEMIPSLKADEKAQILAWLKEAREFAIDAGTSKAKHAWFGKYKGRINNWLAAKGYDLKKERENWYKRIEALKEKK